MARKYQRKHFYEVTWTNANGFCPEGGKTHLFCMVGYRKPTVKEAEVFLKNKMEEWCYDTVSSVREISKEEALEDFQMDGWEHTKVFE